MSDKSFIYRTARKTYRSLRGVYRVARAVRNRCLNAFDTPIVLLVYHRVTELDSDPEMIAVDPDNFRRHMEYLKQHCRVLRIDEDWIGLREPGVVITFDDGYADNFLQALPILEALEVPATFYVSTGRVGTEEMFWWDRLQALVLDERDMPSTFRLSDPRHGKTWQTESVEQRRKLYDEISQLMRGLRPEEQDDWLEQLESWSGTVVRVSARHRCLNRSELEALAASPWATIGGHTRTHTALSAFDEQRQKDEIFSSKAALEEITGREIMTFSYPFGRRRDYDRNSVRICREAGFRRVAANFPGQVHRWTDLMQLPRHLVRNWDVDTFAEEVKRFWTR